MHGTGGNWGTGIGARGEARAPIGPQQAGRARDRASQRIVEQLRLSIRQGRLTPGDRLPAERELCERHGVSRVTIREALRVLEASGLVDIRLGSHGGAFVTSPSAERAAAALEDYVTLSNVTPADINEIRTIMDGGLVPLACQRATDDDLDNLARAYDEVTSAWQDGRYDVRAIRDFHVHIARAAGNDAAEVLLWSLYGPPVHAADRADLADRAGSPHEARTTQGEHERGAAPGRTEEQQRDVDDHRQLLEAIRQRDAERAVALSRAIGERWVP